MESNQNLKYIVYVTMNMINGKIYIGVHGTTTPYEFDNYLGCGSYSNRRCSYHLGKFPLHRAILKYGPENFKRATIAVFDTAQEALDLEALLVNEEFVKQDNNYNATVGGGKPPLLNKTVYQFDINGNFISEWKSGVEIRNYFDSSVSFTDIIQSKRSYAGYLWSFDKEINPKEFKLESNRGFISQYDLKGNFIKKYKTTTDASEELGIQREHLTYAVFKKKPYNGFYFLKSDVKIEEVLKSKFKPSSGKQFIYRYKLSGEFDKEYSTTSEAAKDTQGAYTSSLKNAVVNGCKCGNYLWSYKKADNYFNIDKPCEKKEIKVAQYDLDGNFIKLWTQKECKKEFKYCLKCCRGDVKSTQGYKFEYVEDSD